MKLPSNISQSEEVLTFFETKSEDLNPPTEWVTIIVYLINHRLSTMTVIWAVRYQTLPPGGLLIQQQPACVCVVQQLGQSPFTRADPSWSRGFAVSRDDGLIPLERHCVLLIMISGRWHLIPEQMRKDQRCHESAAEFKSRSRRGSQTTHLSYSVQSQSGSNYRLAAKWLFLFNHVLSFWFFVRLKCVSDFFLTHKMQF